MSVITSVVFTVIGGLVAGGVGYFATIVSLREQRKQRHLEDHKNNLSAVSKAIDQISSEVWPFVYGAENLKLPKSPFGNEKRVQNIQIKSEPIAMELTDPYSSDNRIIQVGINRILYDDIQVHFPELHKSLEKTELAVNESGKQILILLNSLSANIYEKLSSSDIDFPYWDGNKTVLKKFTDLKNEVIEMDYAGNIFLIVIGEDEDNWPNKIRWLKNNNIYNEIKRLGEGIRNEFGGELNQLLELRDRIFQHINEAKEEINRIELTTKLKGRCKYL
ncbi:MAG: hypothetical protein JRN37_00580 [Nitrososphaerota archaeon]|jgi:hypothetical protein|nr:hypothetical protein [Nitrososphaerota archaeon]MDG7037647.1 hypothetical protein [Nitrososphaerota archaeon]